MFIHSVNATLLVEKTITLFGYSASEREKILAGTLLHDIGKVLWPPQFAYKKLEKQDLILIHTHPLGGTYLVQDSWLEVPSEVLRIIKEHHERIDGSGYPEGLKGDEIHPYTHIVSAVEVFTAMTEYRPYRAKTYTPQEALSIMYKDSFDRHVLDTLDFIAKGGMRFV